MTEIKMENGRSMVEMLGVLAVMGVLSIGGVAGYRYAIDKMNANDIINEVRKRAVTASQQRILGHDINLSEYGDNGRIKGIHAVTATNDYAGDKGFFALTVSAVPQRVCDKILDMDWAMPVEMTIGGVVVDENTVCAEGNNEMLFAFANTLDSSLIPGEAGEDDGDEEEVQACGENEYQLSTGECVTDSHPECGDGEFYNGLTVSCTTCPTEGSPVQNDASDMEDTCEKCIGARIGGADPTYYCVYCPNGVACGDQCCGEGQVCREDVSSWPSFIYTCDSTLDVNECTTNDDCGPNQFCLSEYACRASVGVCTMLDSMTITLDNGKEYTASTDEMSYHAAVNFCKALKKNLVTLEENCTVGELAELKTNGYVRCSGWKKTDGNIFYRYWTNTKRGGCHSYDITPHGVFSSFGSVGSHNWNNTGRGDHALCR